MRTTLELDDDLHTTAKQMARQQGVTLGRVVSDLTRQSLTTNTPMKIRNGVRIFERKPGGPKVDMELVNKLRDEE